MIFNNGWKGKPDVWQGGRRGEDPSEKDQLIGNVSSLYFIEITNQQEKQKGFCRQGDNQSLEKLLLINISFNN